MSSPNEATIHHEPLDSGLKPAGYYAFASNLQLRFRGRPHDASSTDWQELGETPGLINIPVGFEIECYCDPNDAELSILVAELKQLSRSHRLTLIVEELDDSQHEISDAGLMQLGDLIELQGLGVWTLRHNNTWMACLKDFTRLTRLHIGWIITTKDLTHIAGLTGLTSLEIETLETKIDLSPLATLVHLTSLVIRGQVTDDDLVSLEPLSNLSRLELSGCRLTDNGLAHLRNLTNLTVLKLCGGFSDKGIKHLQGLGNLVDLDLSGCGIDDGSLSSLMFLTNLEHLDLSDCYRITDIGLLALRALPKLARVDLKIRYTVRYATDDEVAYMLGQPSLPVATVDSSTSLIFRSVLCLTIVGRPKSEVDSEWKKLGDTPGTIIIPPDYDIGVCIWVWDELPHYELRSLAVSFPNVSQIRYIGFVELGQREVITDSLVELLTPYTGLTSLDLKNEMVTDVGLAHLTSSLLQLAKVSVAQCPITDKGLLYLKRLPNLRELDLRGCNQISNSAIDNIKRPDLIIRKPSDPDPDAMNPFDLDSEHTPAGSDDEIPF